MSLEGENLRRNRLEQMGLPGFGKNPGSPHDIRPRHDTLRPPINDSGIDLEGSEFQPQFGLPLHARERERRHEQPAKKGRPRTVYALIAASVVAIGSLLANYVQLERSIEDERNRDALRQRLGEVLRDNDDRQEENVELRRRQKKLEFDNQILETDVARLQRELIRLREAYRSTVLETQRPLTENGDSVTRNTNDSGRVRGREGSRINK